MSFVLAALLLSFWVQVRTDAFVVKSPLGAEQAFSVLEGLETFYQIVGGQVFQGVRTPALPLEVLVLQPEEINRLGADYLGDTGDVTGFYQKGIDRDFIVLSADLSGEVSTSVVYHELTHYLASRAMVRPPTWLNEGLGEYFGSASISGGSMSVGEVLENRIRVLTTEPTLPLSDLFAVDPNSSYYSEKDTANVFYAQAWGLVHFLMQGPYSAHFAEYLVASRKNQVELVEFLPVDQDELEREFLVYINQKIRNVSPLRIEGLVRTTAANAHPIDRAHVDASLADLLLATGRNAAAELYLDAAAGYEPIQSRIEYTRGVMAWLGSQEQAREHFIDALVDDEFGSHAAFHLVQMLELEIPEVLSTLEQAAKDGNREPMVYWALSEIYMEEIRRIKGLVEVASSRPVPPEISRMTLMLDKELDLQPIYEEYASVRRRHIEYQLLTSNEFHPQARDVVLPYYPDDLRENSIAGDVVLDAQLSPEGDVIGVWLISSVPDVFGNLATAAVRDWKFDPIPSKLRVVIRFVP